MTILQLKKLNTFAAICKVEGKKESDYDVAKGKNAGEKAAICFSRMRLIYKPFNGKKKADFANTEQPKYYVWADIIADTSRPFGFRLSCDGYVCDNSYSFLGARPYLLNSSHVRIVFEQFTYEHEQWMHWENMANQE